MGFIFRVPGLALLFGIWFVFVYGKQLVSYNATVVPMDCGSPELGEVDHVKLANCTVKEVLVEGPANRPRAYYLALSAAGSESVDALIKLQDHTLAGNSVERYATQVLASDGLEAFRDDTTNADSIVFVDFPDVAAARFVGVWVVPGGQPLYVFPLLLVLGGIGLGVFDAFRLRKKWLSRKKRNATDGGNSTS